MSSLDHPRATPRELDLLPVMLQDEHELEQLLETAERWLGAPPRAVAEFGVFAGGSLARFAERWPAARVIGVDPSPEPSAEGLWRHFPNVTIIRGRSQDEKTRARVLELAGGPVELVHVDGDHSLSAASEDWRWARAATRRPGVVAFHDVNRRDAAGPVEVWRLWDELAADASLNTATIGAGAVYGIGVVRL